MANHITINKIYEGLVQLESKLDALEQKDFKTRRRFTIFVYVILLFELVNIFVHIYF